MLDLRQVETQIRKYEKIVHDFYQEDVIDLANNYLRDAINDFSEWCEEQKPQIDTSRVALDHSLESIRALEERINDIRKQIRPEKLDMSNNDTIARHNERIERCNSLTAQHQRMADDYKQQERLYNERVEQFNQEQRNRQTEIETVALDLRQKVEWYQKWIAQNKPMTFWRGVNRLYASLIQSAQDSTDYTVVQLYSERLKRIRRQLSDHMMQQYTGMGGCHIVRSILCDSEECCLSVDSGASVTSITPEMVEILRLGNSLGDEVEIVLPNAIHIKARQLTIPKIKVQQMKVDFVKAVVLKDSVLGIDGCIGLNFLDKFDYSINRRGLQLMPTRHSSGKPRFDVFISYKSKDSSHASHVFNFLTKKGYKAFLSEVSLPRGRRTDYLRTIDTAIENSKHFIIVGSSVENLKSSWVEAELQLFELLKREGKKQGNIIPIMSSRNIDMTELPVTLRQYTLLYMDNPAWKKELLDYLPQR